ncbi:MAG TPA: hypothetical protein PLF90_04460 [bacterium]|nr:hypothetical protein [bacterium]
MEKALMFLSFFLGFLSVVMAFVLSYNTNKLVRTEDERAKKIIDEGNQRAQELIKETQKMIEEGNKRTQEMIERMNIAHREMLERMDARMEKMDDTLRFLGTLIKSEGEKTRELINKVLEKMPG